jgi:hypothetical protein
LPRAIGRLALSLIAALALTSSVVEVQAGPTAKRRPKAKPSSSAKARLHRTAGWLVVGHYRNYNKGFHDIGVLAELSKDGSVKAHPSTVACKVFRSKRHIVRLRLSRARERFRIQGKPSSNEANSCVGHHAKLAAGHFVASRGAKVRPLRARKLGATERKATAQLALAAIRKAAPQLPVQRYTHKVRHHGFAAGKRGLVAVRVALTPKASCKHALCTLHTLCGGTVRQTALVLIDSKAKKVLYVDVRRTTRKDDYRGKVSFVDALLPKGAHGPWLVLFNDACEGWDFDLIAPDASGRYKRVATGGQASTI